MKKDYKYLLSSGPDFSHLFDVQIFALLRDAETMAKQCPHGRAWKIERTREVGNVLETEEIDNAKKAAQREAEKKRRAYCASKGYGRGIPL